MGNNFLTDATGGYIPSHSLELEQCLLGCVLVDPAALDRVGGEVTAEDFYRPAHADIFSAMKRLQASREEIDLMTLSNRLEVDGFLDRVGGRTYLSELTCAVVTSANAVSYAKGIRLHSNRRQVALKLGEALAQVNSSDDPVNMLMEKATTLSPLSTKGKSLDGEGLAGEFWEALDKTKSPVAKLGLNRFDKAIGPLMRGEMSVFAAPPGTGKTAMALQVAHESMLMGNTVLFVSAEMPSEELTSRIVQRRSNLNMRAIKNGDLKMSEYEARLVGDALDFVAKSRFRVFQTPSMPSPAMVRSEIVRMRAKGESPDLVIVDFLTLFYMEAESKRAETRTMELDVITQLFRDMSKEFDCHFMVLSQFNREGSRGAEPSKHHLRDSGAVEQNANQIFLMWPEQEQAVGLLATAINIKLDKNRGGPLFKDKVDFIGGSFTFIDANQ